MKTRDSETSIFDADMASFVETLPDCINPPRYLYASPGELTPAEEEVLKGHLSVCLKCQSERMGSLHFDAQTDMRFLDGVVEEIQSDSVFQVAKCYGSLLKAEGPISARCYLLGFYLPIVSSHLSSALFWLSDVELFSLQSVLCREALVGLEGDGSEGFVAAHYSTLLRVARESFEGHGLAKIIGSRNRGDGLEHDLPLFRSVWAMNEKMDDWWLLVLLRLGASPPLLSRLFLRPLSGIRRSLARILSLPLPAEGTSEQAQVARSMGETRWASL